MRDGVRLGIDVGSVRVGVARSDPRGLVATPLAPVAAGPDAIPTVAALARESAAIEILVGHPVGLSGEPGRAASVAAEFARELAVAAPGIRVALLDERLTTVEATRRLREAGRDARQSRDAVDSASAVVILHHALEIESRTGRPPGITVGRARRSKRREVP